MARWLVLWVLLVCVLGFAAQAQSGLRVEGGTTLFISVGDTVVVPGAVSNAGTITNQGLLVLGSSFLSPGTYQNNAITEAQYDSLVMIGAVGGTVADFNGGNSGYFFYDANGTGEQLTLMSALFINRQLGLTEGIINASPGLLTLGVDAISANAGVGNFVVGPMRIQRGPASPPAIFPIGSAISLNYRPMVIYNGGSFGPGLSIDAEVVDGDPGATVAPGEPFVRPSTTRVHRFQVVAGTLFSIPEVEVAFGPDDNVATLGTLGMGLGQGAAAGPYQATTTISTAGLPAAGSVRISLPLVSLVGPQNFLILGVNKVIAGDLFVDGLNPGPTTVAPGDRLGLIELQNFSAVTGELYTFELAPQATGIYSNLLGPSATTSIAAPSTTPIFEDVQLRAIVSAPGYEADTTAPFLVNLGAFTAIDLRAFLQGVYQLGGTMDGTGFTGAELKASPAGAGMYADAAFEPPDNTVDVITIELRTVRDDPVSTVGSTQAWLLDDGTVIDYRTGDPLQNVARINVAPGDYYVVVRHRNHLPVVSANPITLSSTPTIVDMTSPSVVYELPGLQRGGFFYPTDNNIALFAGNVFDQPGTIASINAVDFALVRLESNIAPPAGYHLLDVNLDSFVNAMDYLLTQANQNQLYFSLVAD